MSSTATPLPGRAARTTRLGSRPQATVTLSRTRRLWTATLAIAAALVAWQFAALVFSSVLFPPVTETAVALVELFGVPELRGHIAVTVGRVLAGFLLGGLTGVVLGLTMGSITPVRRFFEPYLHFFRFVTPLAWVAPATIWFGTGEMPKLFLVIYATLFIVVINTIAGVTYIHRDKVRMARTFGAGRWVIFSRITLPMSVPFILVGMRIAMGNSFMTVIGAEMLSANNGLGYLIYSSRIYFESATMFATIFLLGVLGFAADRAFAQLQRRVFGRFEAVR